MSNLPFNPLDTKALARAVGKAMLERPCLALPPEDPFPGAGIYAIYYTGAFPAYKKIAALNRDQRFGAPIYIGRAVPQGARKGRAELAQAAGSVLYSRLRQHAESVRQAANLDLADFFCRHLVVEGIWIPLGERLLIRAYAPLWNRVVDGFGNHDPGTRRKGQWRSDWDVLHPGRPWAEKLGKSSRNAAAIMAEIREFLDTWEPREL